MDEDATPYDSDEDFFNDPPWKLHRKGFIDLRVKEAEDFNNILERHIPSQVQNWNCVEEHGWQFDLEHLVLHIEQSAIGPIGVKVTTGVMPRVYVDPLRRIARQIVARPLESNRDMTGFAILLLQVIEEAVMWIETWKPDAVQPRRAWNVREVASYSEVRELLDNPFGADLDTVDDSGFHLLGKSVKGICETIPSQYRILHVEPVFRTDLVRRFRKRQNEMMEQMLQMPYHWLRKCVSPQTIRHQSLEDNKYDLAKELCKVRSSFHGTQRQKIASIVRWGFVKPGEKAGENIVGMNAGASFGVGTYSSPDAEYALAYSNMGWSGNEKTRAQDIPGLRLIICAVLMGRSLQVTRDGTRQTISIADETAHSHVSPNMLEYVVFESSQIIPCYVIHLDFGAEATSRYLKDLLASNTDIWRSRERNQKPRERGQFLFPGDVEEAKRAKKAAAAKWFPYGYGPAKGTSFVIEEIAEVSDDEEDYGEYQGMRQEVGDEFRRWEEGGEEKKSWFDEYQTSRAVKEGAKVKVVSEVDYSEWLDECVLDGDAG